MNAIVRMLDSGDVEIKRTAITSLKSFKNIENNLLPFLRDKDWATRIATVKVLGREPEGNVRIELEKLLDTEEDPAVIKAVEETLRV